MYLRALPDAFSWEKNRLARALDLLDRAIERDPFYGPALALAAYCRHQLDLNDWAEDRNTNLRTGLELARRALRAGPDDPDVLATASFVLGRLGEDIDTALGLMDHCLTLHPSFAYGWYISGLLWLFAGQPDLALEHFETFLRLSPRERLASHLTGIGEALFFSRRFGEAVAKLLASLEQRPGLADTYRFLASCYAHMGRLDEGREVVKRLCAISPVVVPSTTPFRNPEHRELYLSGLRLAAGELA